MRLSVAFGVVAAASLVLYGGFIFALVRFRHDVRIDPPVFLTEYAKFLGTLTIALLSYVLVHEYVHRRVRLIEARELNLRILHSCAEISRLVVETARPLRDAFDPPQAPPTQPVDLDDVVRANLESLGEHDHAVLTSLDAADRALYDDEGLRRLSHYRASVHPIVADLLSLALRVHQLDHFFHDGIATLDAIGTAMYALLQYYHETTPGARS